MGPGAILDLDDDRGKARIVMAVTLLLLMATSFAVGYLTRGNTNPINAVESATSCELIEELHRVNQSLADALTGSYRTQDILAIGWRQLMGDICNSVRDSHDLIDQQIEDATWQLDRAILGVTNEPWSPEQLAAWQVLRDASETKCGVVLGHEGHAA